MVFEHVLYDAAPKPISLLHGVAIVHATVDARVVHLAHNILEAGECMGGASHGARDYERYLISSKKCGQSIGKSLSHAAVRRRILGMTGRHRQRNPVRIRHGLRIDAGIGIMDGGVGSPECIVILSR
jgi:hypothetical protein